MRKKQVYNPYALEEGKQKDYHRLLLFATLGASLIGSLFFFPLSQMLTANGADAVWKYLVYYISEIVSVGALFSVLALFTVAVAHEEHTLRKKTMLWEILTLVFISFALRIFLYWLAAFLDKQLMLDFYFNDKTLDHLVRGGALLSYIVSSLLNLPVLLLVLFVSLRLVRSFYRKSNVRGEAVPMMKKIPVVVYLAVAVIFAAIETGFTIAELGFSLRFQVVTTILMPYIEIALFSLLGYYVLSYLVDAFDKK
ncbi:MAG: hypothetical protein IJD35_03350 [Clostridia bacterium]|nr:hypothetical protein [Clostridia bacterium]